LRISSPSNVSKTTITWPSNIPEPCRLIRHDQVMCEIVYEPRPSPVKPQPQPTPSRDVPKPSQEKPFFLQLWEACSANETYACSKSRCGWFSMFSDNVKRLINNHSDLTRQFINREGWGYTCLDLAIKNENVLLYDLFEYVFARLL
jgi:hypothetical protein